MCDGAAKVAPAESPQPSEALPPTPRWSLQLGRHGAAPIFSGVHRMPKCAFYDDSQNPFDTGWGGFGFLWIRPAHCCIDIKKNEGDDAYYRFVPPGADKFKKIVPE